MSEMKKIRMGEASFNYSPETAYEKNGNVYCNTCHEQINGEVINMMGTWMCCVLQDFPTQYCKEKVHTFAPEIFL